MNAVEAGALYALEIPSPNAKPIDPFVREPSPRQHGERRAEHRGHDLRDHEQAAPIKAIRSAARPRRENEHGNEVREVEDPEQERGMCEPEDEQLRGEILEPRACGR